MGVGGSRVVAGRPRAPVSQQQEIGMGVGGHEEPGGRGPEGRHVTTAGDRNGRRRRPLIESVTRLVYLSQQQEIGMGVGGRGSCRLRPSA